MPLGSPIAGGEMTFTQTGLRLVSVSVGNMEALSTCFVWRVCFVEWCVLCGRVCALWKVCFPSTLLGIWCSRSSHLAHGMGRAWDPLCCACLGWGLGSDPGCIPRCVLVLQLGVSSAVEAGAGWRGSSVLPRRSVKSPGVSFPEQLDSHLF